MARKQRNPHPDQTEGRMIQEVITNLKKGSSMPAAEEGEPTKQFIVAPFVRMGAPDGSGIVEGGDPVQLTKPQAEWCMANGFIDSILPDFDEPSIVTQSFASDQGSLDLGSEEKGSGSEPETDGAGNEGVGGTSQTDSPKGAPKRAPRRAKAKI